MSRPGDRLRALAVRVCASRAIERVLDPAIADFRWEDQDALRRRHSWRARWIRLTGSLTLLYLIVRCAIVARADRLGASLTNPATLARVLAGPAAVVAVMTAVLLAIIVGNTPAPVAHRPWLVLYLLPATLPCTVPCGFALAVFWMDGGCDRPRQSAPSTLIVASALSVTTLATVGWLLPASNQAYRVAVEGWQIPRGFNELTLSAQRRQLSVERARLALPFGARGAAIDPTFDLRIWEFMYQGRLAVSVAPLVLGLFALAMARRSHAVRRTAMISMLAMYFVWYGWDSPLQTFASLAPALVAWLPNLTLLAVASTALVRLRHRSNERCG